MDEGSYSQLGGGETGVARRRLDCRPGEEIHFILSQFEGNFANF